MKENLLLNIIIYSNLSRVREEKKKGECNDANIHASSKKEYILL